MIGTYANKNNEEEGLIPTSGVTSSVSRLFPLLEKREKKKKRSRSLLSGARRAMTRKRHHPISRAISRRCVVRVSDLPPSERLLHDDVLNNVVDRATRLCAERVIL